MVKLERKNGRLFALTNRNVQHEESEIQPCPVTIAWLRPISGYGKEITLIGENNEFQIIENLNSLDSDSRKIAEEELENNYLIFHIKEICKTMVHLGNRYFEVITDKGKCSFIVKNPFVSIREYGENGLFIRDNVGNLYIIDSVSDIDERSKKELEKVI